MELKVMLVDDDEMANFLQTLILKSCKLAADIDCFLNGQLALDHLLAIDNQNMTFLILLDANMPVMNGWELLEALSRQSFQSTVHVALLSSYVDEDDIRRLKNYPMVVGHFEKPVSAVICSKIMALPELTGFYTSTPDSTPK